MTQRERNNMSQSCQDARVDNACRDAKRVEVVLMSIIVEVDVEPIEVEKHANCWGDHLSFLKKQWSSLFDHSSEETCW